MLLFQNAVTELLATRLCTHFNVSVYNF